MTRRLLALVLGLLAVAAAAGAQPVVRVSVAQKPPLLVGQQIRVDVQVFVPNFFMGAPRFPTLEVPGAIVTLSDDAVNLNETIRGEAYAGILRSYLLVASSAGQYALPPAQVQVTYAAVPGQPPTTVGVALPRTELTVEWPAGMSPADVPDGMLVARVTVQQHLDRSDFSLRVGEALTRTIDSTAERTAAMFIPPPTFAAPTGVQTYPRDPVLRNSVDGRGALVAGHRTDAVVYVFQRPGTFELPAIEFPWYDIGARRSRSATAPAITVTVAPSPTTASIAPEAEVPPPPAPPRRNWRRIGATGAAGLVLLSVVWMLWRRIPRWLARYSRHRAQAAASEPARFAQFKQACRHSRPAEAYGTLLDWMRTRPLATSGDWRQTGDPVFEEEVRRLEATLFAPAAASSSWNGHELGKAAAGLRNARTEQIPPTHPGRHLSVLNPAGTDLLG
jgi:hypothetical protein